VGDQARGVFIKWGSVPHSKTWGPSPRHPMELRLWCLWCWRYWSNDAVVGFRAM